MSDLSEKDTRLKFTKRSRLLAKKDYDAVFKRAKRCREGVVQFFLKQKRHEEARLGMIIPKKSVKRSVDRNRLKRVIRENFRHAQPHLTYDVIISIRKGGACLANKDLHKILSNQWENLTN